MTAQLEAAKHYSTLELIKNGSTANTLEVDRAINASELDGNFHALQAKVMIFYQLLFGYQVNIDTNKDASFDIGLAITYNNSPPEAPVEPDDMVEKNRLNGFHVLVMSGSAKESSSRYSFGSTCCDSCYRNRNRGKGERKEIFSICFVVLTTATWNPQSVLSCSNDSAKRLSRDVLSRKYWIYQTGGVQL